MSNGFKVSLTAARPALLAAENNTVDVLARIQAPDAPGEGLPERPRLNLAVVIDRSGSMAGEPLRKAKQAAEFMIDSLEPTDHACVVAYDDKVKVVVTSRPVEDKASFRAAIEAIEAGGMTNLHGGWLGGADEAAPHIRPNVVSRVLLLSDGQANSGLTRTDEIADQCARLAEQGLATSTYGLGFHFNERLMQAMARSGRGNAYYSEAAESLVERFREEFSLLSALCARDLRLSLTPMAGATIEMLNPYATAEADNGWRLPDLVYNGECWALVRVSLPSQNVPAAGETATLLQAAVAYVDLDGGRHELPEVRLTLPCLADAAYAGIAVDEKVAARRAEAEAAGLQERASRAARQGQWNTVDEILRETRNMAKYSPWLDQIVKTLEELASRKDRGAFGKEAIYSALALSERIRPKREFDADFNEKAAPLHLRKKIRQGGKEQFGAEFARTTDYPLEQFDNYPVAAIDGKRVLLDTGSPFSVGDGGVIEISGQRFTLKPTAGLTTDKLARWMKTEIDALLGGDVLSRFVISIDWWRSALKFAPPGAGLTGTKLPARLLMGTPLLEFLTPSGTTQGLFDTGAKLCYAPRSAAANKTPITRTQDFLPGFGEFNSDVYELRIEFSGHAFLANCGILPDSVARLLQAMAGIEWIIGTDLLRQGIIGVDLGGGRVTAEWK